MNESVEFRYRGEGRGVITLDGSAVELYLRSAYRGEIEDLARWLTPGCSVLELGCGVGRMTRPLLARGCSVTAVDNSPEMLVHVPDGAHKICSHIEELHLRRQFDVVLYASNLINTPNASARREQLRVCRRHLGVCGSLLFERFDPDWLAAVEPGPAGRLSEDVAVHVDRVGRAGNVVEISLRYSTNSEEWLQHFPAQVLRDADVERLLTEAGFASVQWINKRWGRAS
jgi:SAM-dependent methyltransferase